jgi:hypothetical protein
LERQSLDKDSFEVPAPALKLHLSLECEVTNEFDDSLEDSGLDIKIIKKSAKEKLSEESDENVSGIYGSDSWNEND